MNNLIKELLRGNSGDNIFPFFWQHGEDEQTLRKMMKSSSTSVPGRKPL